MHGVSMSFKRLILLYNTKLHNITQTVKYASNASHTKERFPRFRPEEKMHQTEVLASAIQDFKISSNAEWEQLRDRVLGSGSIVNSINFDAKVMGCCLTYKNLEAANSYLRFIETNNAKPNMATVGKLLRLYFICNEKCETINKAQEDIIIDIYNNLKSTNAILDSITAENAIHALSITHRWRECMELLDLINISSKPTASTYSAIVQAMFRNKEYENGWALLQSMISMDRLPHPSTYHVWLKESGGIASVERLLRFFGDNDVLPTKCVTERISEMLADSYTSKYTSIHKNGLCKACGTPLEDIHINPTDFDQLRSTFFDNVIVGKNVFNKTTPEELNKFKQYLDNIKYDVVVDGLNVAYSAGNKRPYNTYTKLLTSVVQHFSLQSKKVLLLGRAHMMKWPKMDYIKANAHVFLAANLSQDDPFLLYAAMKKGLGTCFLSRDLMRGHSYLLLDENLRRLFRRWQQLYQYSLVYVENNGKVHIKHPFKCLSTAHSHENGWHIPYVTEHMAKPPITLDPPVNWLCLRKTK